MSPESKPTPNNGTPNDSPNPQGCVVDNPQGLELIQAMDMAFDYRGDVTITLRDGLVLMGYVFDRRLGQGLEDSVARIMLADGGKRCEIRYSEVTRIAFTGKDTAAGKSWETWVKQYAQKNLGKPDPENLTP